MDKRKLPIVVFLLYLSLTAADPMPFALFFLAVAAGGTGPIEWLDAALILVGIFHICLLYRWLGEHKWHRPKWVIGDATHTPTPTPVSTAHGYAATSLIYDGLAIASFAILPPSTFTKWLFWFVITAAISFWFTVPQFLPSFEFRGQSALGPALAATPLITVALATSPTKITDAAYVVATSVLLVALIASGVHVHHSAWPWAALFLCRHPSPKPDTRAALSAVAAGIFIGMATQEIAGSGFNFVPHEGW